MTVTTDIVQSWRRPRRVLRRLLDTGRREDRALVYLMLACLLIFVAQWPRLQREAVLSTDVPLEALIAGALFGWLFVAPLAIYGLGTLSHLLARILGGQGSNYSARLALFWSLLATSPGFLFHGLVMGMIGPGPAQTVVGFALLLAFLVIWGMTLIEAEQAPEKQNCKTGLR
ncbi:YIP1 family protein [Rhodophyticola sp. CCM32]|uniref:YIP1 family protein n=1 Tax=Rhodophyticola sp. CCM32 TaxID=2916397 RepID=UPI00107FBA6E|nr:YIP1 family protein [Rhodophyticola sp. CCM32]QBY00412.1 YIP1 family protein [Rhodophyticola sp. CCM32]